MHYLDGERITQTILLSFLFLFLRHFLEDLKDHQNCQAVLCPLAQEETGQLYVFFKKSLQIFFSMKIHLYVWCLWPNTKTMPPVNAREGNLEKKRGLLIVGKGKQE